jgi:hypothetical protein
VRCLVNYISIEIYNCLPSTCQLHTYHLSTTSLPTTYYSTYQLPYLPSTYQLHYLPSTYQLHYLPSTLPSTTLPSTLPYYHHHLLPYHHTNYVVYHPTKRMKSVSRLAIEHAPTPNSALPAVILSCQTLNTLPIGNKYIHFFHPDQAEVSIVFTDCSYRVYWKSTKKTTIRFYTLVGNTLQYMVTTQDKFARYTGKQGSFETTAKILAVATSDDVELVLQLRPIPYKSLCCESCLELRNHRGHETYQLNARYRSLGAQIKDYSSRHSLDRYLSTYSVVPESVEYSSKLEYRLRLDNIITLSARLPSEQRCDPFSVRVKYAANLQATLTYELEVSVENDDEITVTPIETLGLDSYAKISNLRRIHTGRYLQGRFVLPVGITDVGLHFYTPYGFGDDSRKDKYNDLLTWKVFKISYQLL